MARGVIATPGLSYDYRWVPEHDGQSFHDGTEYIEPLLAVAPRGRKVAVGVDPGATTTGSFWRVVTIGGVE